MNDGREVTSGTLGRRARNVYRRPLLFGVVAVSVFMVTLIVLLLIPREAQRAAQVAGALAPNLGERRDTTEILRHLQAVDVDVALAGPRGDLDQAGFRVLLPVAPLGDAVAVADENVPVAAEDDAAGGIDPVEDDRRLCARASDHQQLAGRRVREEEPAAPVEGDRLEDAARRVDRVAPRLGRAVVERSRGGGAGEGRDGDRGSGSERCQLPPAHPGRNIPGSLQPATTHGSRRTLHSRASLA